MHDALPRLNAALQGRYRVERQLGEGGMATVYLAEDLKHRRRVALKVLKPELAAVVGAGRFLAEIETTANLQHPHILPLFDSGEADGFLFYVMPHVEGESLRDRLDREHQLPVDEAVRIATNVAEALDYAHTHGVIHRDIKPANILLQSGKPVIADFGIALAVTSGGAGRLTETGLSLGTPHYMSPEQATGDGSVGAATDIWALGCVLYEMLVGEPPYTGSTPQAVLGKIITAEPASASEARRSVAPNVDATIRKALEKVPADRFRSAEEFARALEDRGFRYGDAAAAREGEAGAGGAREALRAALASLRRWKRLGVGGWAAFAALLAIVIATGTLTQTGSGGRGAPGALPATSFVLSLSDDRAFAGGGLGVNLAWSPDGSRLVYVGLGAGGALTQLWQRRLDELVPQPVPGSEGARNPVFSPDGLSVAFTAGGALRTLSLLGGPPFTVVAQGVPDGAGGIAWEEDGMLYFSAGGALHRVPSTGGPPEVLTAPDPGTSHRWVEALVGGRGILFTIFRSTPADSEIAAATAEGGELRVLFGGAMARYASSGHVIYASAAGTLLAVPFDLRRLEATGPAVALLQGVDVYGGAASQFALSRSGGLAYVEGAGGGFEIVRVDRRGAPEQVDPGWTGYFPGLALSPDGSRLAVTIVGEGSTDIWVKLLDRGPLSRLTFEGTENFRPTWTPDGGSVAFVSNRDGASSLWMQRADGTGEPEPVLRHDAGVLDAQWSTDGEWLVARVGGSAGTRDIVGLRRATDTVPVPLVATRFDEVTPALSPDGRWLAYVSNESGRNEVYVRPFPEVDRGRWQISTAGGTWPLWAHSGRELFYRNGADDLVAVEVSAGAAFQSGEARVLFAAIGYQFNFLTTAYAVAPDDEHFYMVRPTSAGPGGRQDVTVVQNFFTEVRARAGR
jgi:serine/threonine-protein kinase